ncbi:hypothetical protein BUALT_Bualt12G0127500 [Buddleja alternifolia]|uniref:Zinc finger PMZ-type domain-containing protein n=1 Tax=Buddleja alternifolia TaxID=168488 RepID=A0AAV6X1K1_9LAMI|nr:hypothetical protein BUALT_Bualt12G0127500 [Buddleja alternifolia]
MSLRDPNLNDLPPPHYYQPVVTLVIYHGGQFSTRAPKYLGGEVSKFDHVDLNIVGFDYLDKICESLGYMGKKRYYNLETYGFVLISESHHVLQLCLLHESDREVPIYLEASLDVLSSQVGTSRAEVNESKFWGEESSKESIQLEDFTDSDYEVDIDDEDENGEGDNTLFETNVDREVEWEGNEETNSQNNENDEGDETDEMGDTMSDSSDFNSGKDFDDENGEKYPVFSEQDTYDPKFVVGLCFSNKKEFRQVVRSHAVNTKRNIKIPRNDKRRMYAKCAVKVCQWRIHALKVGNESSYQIREYHSKHNFGGVYHVKNCNSAWIGNFFEDLFRTDPNRNVDGFRQDVIKKINIHVSQNQAYRAKSSNPGSTVIMSMSGAGVFGIFYVCFKGLKDGFFASCRPYIGVDGCHLKGPNGGVLLATVGIDPNNNSFPICYAVVGRETKELWEWFLTLLKHDLQFERDYEWTFMSDKQKGFIPAFETVFPTADSRYCVRHLHGNMKVVGFWGDAYKKMIWKAARASTVGEFNTRMKEMTKFDKKVVERLNDKSLAREKQIHTMLEMIRKWLMQRMQENRDRKWELSGIPCKHALSAINAQELNPEDFVHQCYTVETYARVYAPCIYPVNGPDKWKETGQVPPIPPNLGKGVGRPPRARRKDAEVAESEEANDHVVDEGSSEPVADEGSSEPVADEGSSEHVAEAANEYELSTEHDWGLGDDWGVDWDKISKQASNMEAI